MRVAWEGGDNKAFIMINYLEPVSGEYINGSGVAFPTYNL